MSVATESPVDLAVALRERGLRVTPQRLFIYRALVELDRHVSAEEVLAAVNAELPNISLPTVYSTLDLFKELGLVRQLGVTQGAVLYDPRIDSHHHRICDTCGAIEDIEADPDLERALATAGEGGFQTDRAEVLVHGRCRDCATRSN
jgi:Fe2+ or Zn2+ uptake regulation protein